MRRLFARLAYFARSALRGLRGGRGTSAVAVCTIAVVLVLLGSFALLLSNMQGLLSGFGAELHVTAYLEEGLPDRTQRELAERAGRLAGVEGVRLVTKAQALERFRAGVGRAGALLEGLEENPLPASLEIVLAPERRSPAGLAAVSESLSGLAGIDDVASGGDWVEGYLRALALLRVLALGLGGILGLAALLVVAGAIRLAILARRDELEILSLVGASRGFVRTPFLLEGALEGALGGSLALLALYALFRLVLPGLEFGLELLLGGMGPHFFAPAQAALLVASGAGLGLFGSALALLGEARA